MKKIQFGQSQILNPEKWETKKPKYKTDQKPRITIYCKSEKQKDFILNQIATIKNKNNVDESSSDVVENLILFHNFYRYKDKNI